MADTFERIWNEVHGHSKAVDPLLVQSWVRDTWREIAESRTWSWLRKKGLLTIAAPYTTGTAAMTPGSTTVQLTGAVSDSSFRGRQFRSGTGAIYDITEVDTATHSLEIWPAWGDSAAPVSGRAYKVFTAYLQPNDPEFFTFISIVNAAGKRRLRLHVNQETIDYYDGGRKITAQYPACISGLDWTRSYAGRIGSVLQVSGAGPKPVSGGTYTGQTDSILVIKITLGGARDVAKFSWQKDSGTVNAGNVVSSLGNSIPEGIEFSWPASVFVLGDIFVVRLTAKPQYGYPRYELYPHHTGALYMPYTYATRVHDIDEDGFVLPYTMRGDVIKLGALAKMARYPGTEEKPNPFAQIARATKFEEQFEVAVGELRTADDYIMETNVTGPEDQWDWALLPWMSINGTVRPTADFDPRDMFI